MSKESLISAILKKFNDLFNTTPILINAPGRINLIGEHTDYNDGFVLPAAIDKSIVFAMAENNVGVHRFYSLDFDDYHETSNISMKAQRPLWAQYLIGVITQFLKKGKVIKGIDCVFGGDIPIGAGLSSSAALECGFAFGLNHIYNFNYDDFTLVKMAQKAEHEYAGVMCGIMDQYASVFGQKDQVFRLDCRTNKHLYFNFKMDDFLMVLVDTKVKHQLASSEYNVRREECEAGVSYMRNYDTKIKSIRDINRVLLEEHKIGMDSIVYKRCSYVISENERVLEACEALEQNNFTKFGDLLYKSHKGLKDEFEVSCRELDILVDITKNMEEVLGSRMMGGGFGGCTINLIYNSDKEKFVKKVGDDYLKQTDIYPDFYFVKPDDGVRLINV